MDGPPTEEEQEWTQSWHERMERRAKQIRDDLDDYAQRTEEEARRDFGPLVRIYDNVTIGKDVFIGEFTHVRERTIIGDRVSIGSHCQIEGDLTIGDDTRLHSNVHVSKGAKVGKRCFLANAVQFTNVRFPLAKNPAFKNKIERVTIEDDVKVGAAVVLCPGITVGHDALIGAGAVVTKDVPPYAIVIGVPAKVVGDVRDLEAYRE